MDFATAFVNHLELFFFTEKHQGAASLVLPLKCLCSADVIFVKQNTIKVLCSSSYYYCYYKKTKFSFSVKEGFVVCTSEDDTHIQIQHAFKALYRSPLVEFLKRSTTERTETLSVGYKTSNYKQIAPN